MATLGMMLNLVVGVALSPSVSAHIIESHGAPLSNHGNDAHGHESVDSPGSTHDDHHHSTIGVVGDGIRYRVEQSVDAPTWSAAPGLVRCIEYLVASAPVQHHYSQFRTTVLRI